MLPGVARVPARWGDRREVVLVEQAPGAPGPLVGDDVGGGVHDDAVGDGGRAGGGVPPEVLGRRAGDVGEAIDVPLSRLVAVSPVFQSELIDVPGVKRSRQGPKFE